MLRLLADMVGEHVLVRSRGSGVWVATLVDAEGTNVLVREARRIWQWRGGALECAELATRGPDDATISVESPAVVITEVCEIHPCAPAARKRILACPEGARGRNGS